MVRARQFRNAVAAAVVLCGVWAARGEVLWSYEWTTSGFAWAPSPRLKPGVFAWQYPEVDEFVQHEVYFPVVGPEDIGITFTLPVMGDPEREGFANLLVNGRPDTGFAFMLIPQPGDAGGGFGFSCGTQFQGCLIEDLSLTLNSLPFADVAGYPDWTQYNFDATFRILGTPEPGTVILLALGALAILRRRRKSHP